MRDVDAGHRQLLMDHHFVNRSPLLSSKRFWKLATACIGVSCLALLFTISKDSIPIIGGSRSCWKDQSIAHEQRDTPMYLELSEDQIAEVRGKGKGKRKFKGKEKEKENAGEELRVDKININSEDESSESLIEAEGKRNGQRKGEGKAKKGKGKKKQIKAEGEDKVQDVSVLKAEIAAASATERKFKEELDALKLEHEKEVEALKAELAGKGKDKTKGKMRVEAQQEQGTMLSWNYKKGFGFIEPGQGGDAVICPISSLADSSVREGDTVTYSKSFNERFEKYSALDVRRADSVRGVMTSWSSEKRFGFIKPSDGGDSLFCHHSSLTDGEDSLLEGDEVTFIREFNTRIGKYRAVDVRYSGGENGRMDRWNDRKGYGFIKPFDGSDDVYCHQSSLAEGEGSVRQGDNVVYIKEFNDIKGSYQALHVRRAGSEIGFMHSWNAEKHFGFIQPSVQPSDGSDIIFCHTTGLQDGEGSVAVGDQVTYLRVFDNKKERYYAVDVRLAHGGAETGVAEEGRGQIDRWNEKRSFGFIRPSDGSANLFFLPSAIVDDIELQSGDYVKYSLEYDEAKGKHYALNVRSDPDKGVDHGGVPEGRGQIESWNAEKAFGFIRPSDGSGLLFCHVSALVDKQLELQDGDYVKYSVGYDEKRGKYMAVNVRSDPDKGVDRGTITRWVPDKNFGFIQPNDGTKQAVYFHVSQFAEGEGIDENKKDSVEEGKQVSYYKEWVEPKGAYRALDIRLTPPS